MLEGFVNYSPRITPDHVLACLTQTQRKVTRLDIARAYSLMIAESRGSKLDVAELNAAIMARWSVSGLNWIKREAWAIATGKR